MDKIEEEDEDEAGEEALVPTGSFDGSPRVRLTLADGSELLAQAAVVATEAPAAAKLLGEEVALAGGASPSTGRSSTCLYFAIDGPAPVGAPSLLSGFVLIVLFFYGCQSTDRSSLRHLTWLGSISFKSFVEPCSRQGVGWA